MLVTDSRQLAVIGFINSEEYSEIETVEKYIEQLHNGVDSDELDHLEEYEDIVKVEDLDLDDLHNYNTFRYGNAEYACLDDDEADDETDEILNNVIDEALEIPDNLRPYFDEEKWKRDALMDGRGHYIASYDGEENEYTLGIDDSEWYFYRTN